MRRSRLPLALIAALLLSPALLKAQDSALTLLRQGNELYKTGKFESAAQTYQKAVATGIQNPDLFYNLGNAQLKAGRLGPAIAAYLRAQRLEPRDPDVAFNLEYARKKIAAPLPETLPGPLAKAFHLVADFLSAGEWTALCIGVYWLLGLAAITAILARGFQANRAARLLLWVSIALLAGALPFAAYRVKQDVFTERAVIVADKVTARSGPGDENAALFELAPGIDLAVGQCQSGWCRVSAPGGFIGWVPANQFERL